MHFACFDQGGQHACQTFGIANPIWMEGTKVDWFACTVRKNVSGGIIVLGSQTEQQVSQFCATREGPACDTLAGCFQPSAYTGMVAVGRIEGDLATVG